MSREHPVLDTFCHVLHRANSSYVETIVEEQSWTETIVTMLVMLLAFSGISVYMTLFERLLNRCIQTRVSRETHLRGKRFISVSWWGMVVTVLLMAFSGIMLEFFFAPIFVFLHIMTIGFNMEKKSKLSNGRFLTLSTTLFSMLLSYLAILPLFMILSQHHEFAKQCDSKFLSFTIFVFIFVGSYLMYSVQSVRAYYLSKNASLLFIVENKAPIGEYVRREEGWVEIYLEQNTVTQKLLPNKVAPIEDRVGYFHN